MIELPFNPCQLIMSQMKIWDISDSSKWEALKSGYGIVLHWNHLQVIQALVVRNTDMLELSNITVWNHAVIWLTPAINETMKQNLMSISANALRSCLMSNNCEISFEKFTKMLLNVHPPKLWCSKRVCIINIFVSNARSKIRSWCLNSANVWIVYIGTIQTLAIAMADVKSAR